MEKEKGVLRGEMLESFTHGSEMADLVIDDHIIFCCNFTTARTVRRAVYTYSRSGSVARLCFSPYSKYCTVIVQPQELKYYVCCVDLEQKMAYQKFSAIAHRMACLLCTHHTYVRT